MLISLFSEQYQMMKTIILRVNHLPLYSINMPRHIIITFTTVIKAILTANTGNSEAHEHSQRNTAATDPGVEHTPVTRVPSEPVSHMSRKVCTFCCIRAVVLCI